MQVPFFLFPFLGWTVSKDVGAKMSGRQILSSTREPWWMIMWGPFLFLFFFSQPSILHKRCLLKERNTRPDSSSIVHLCTAAEELFFFLISSSSSTVHAHWGPIDLGWLSYWPWHGPSFSHCVAVSACYILPSTRAATRNTFKKHSVSAQLSF